MTVWCRADAEEIGMDGNGEGAGRGRNICQCGRRTVRVDSDGDNHNEGRRKKANEEGMGRANRDDLRNRNSKGE